MSRKDLKLFQDEHIGLAVSQDSAAGVRKLAQRFVLELFTARDSMYYLPHRGCSFLPRVKRLVRTEFDVQAAFAVARSQVARNLRGDENARMSPDELYAHARLDEIIMDGESIQLTISVYSRAGRGVQLQTPAISLV